MAVRETAALLACAVSVVVTARVYDLDVKERQLVTLNCSASSFENISSISWSIVNCRGSHFFAYSKSGEKLSGEPLTVFNDSESGVDFVAEGGRRIVKLKLRLRKELYGTYTCGVLRESTLDSAMFRLLPTAEIVTGGLGIEPTILCTSIHGRARRLVRWMPESKGHRNKQFCILENDCGQHVLTGIRLSSPNIVMWKYLTREHVNITWIFNADRRVEEIRIIKRGCYRRVDGHLFTYRPQPGVNSYKASVDGYHVTIARGQEAPLKMFVQLTFPVSDKGFGWYDCAFKSSRMTDMKTVDIIPMVKTVAVRNGDMVKCITDAKNSTVYLDAENYTMHRQYVSGNDVITVFKGDVRDATCRLRYYDCQIDSLTVARPLIAGRRDPWTVVTVTLCSVLVLVLYIYADRHAREYLKFVGYRVARYVQI